MIINSYTPGFESMNIKIFWWLKQKLETLLNLAPLSNNTRWLLLTSTLPGVVLAWGSVLMFTRRPMRLESHLPRSTSMLLKTSPPLMESKPCLLSRFSPGPMARSRPRSPKPEDLRLWSTRSTITHSPRNDHRIDSFIETSFILFLSSLSAVLKFSRQGKESSETALSHYFSSYSIGSGLSSTRKNKISSTLIPKIVSSYTIFFWWVTTKPQPLPNLLTSAPSTRLQLLTSTLNGVDPARGSLLTCTMRLPSREFHLWRSMWMSIKRHQLSMASKPCLHSRCSTDKETRSTQRLEDRKQLSMMSSPRPKPIIDRPCNHLSYLINISSYLAINRRLTAFLAFATDINCKIYWCPKWNSSSFQLN